MLSYFVYYVHNTGTTQNAPHTVIQQLFTSCLLHCTPAYCCQPSVDHIYMRCSNIITKIHPLKVIEMSRCAMACHMCHANSLRNRVLIFGRFGICRGYSVKHWSICTMAVRWHCNTCMNFMCFFMWLYFYLGFI